MKKERVIDILYIFMIVTLILFMIFIFFFLRGSAIRCMQEPVKYFEEKSDSQCFCINKGDIFKVNERRLKEDE